MTNNAVTTEPEVGNSITKAIVTGDSINFINHKEATIETGVLLDSLPYVLLLGLVVLGLAAFFWNRRKSVDLD